MAYLGLLALRVAAQTFGCFVLLDAGPYRLEGGGVTGGFILPLGLMDEVEGRVRERAPDEGWSVMKCARVWDGSGNHYYFSHFAYAASLPPESLTSETSSSKKI